MPWMIEGEVPLVERNQNNWLENKVCISFEGEEFKQETNIKHSRMKQDASKESYDNILIMESTDSIANKDLKNASYQLLDKIENGHVNWSEVDDEDNMRKTDLPKL